MKRSVFITLCLLFGMFMGTSFAAEVTIFGPEQFLRTKGAPNVYTDAFSASPGKGKLIIKNGDEDGKHRTTSAKIAVNGEEIFGPSDFKKKVYQLKATIDLLADNSIQVELRGKPGSYLTVLVTQEVDPPFVTISANPASITEGDFSTLTWSSTNADSASIDNNVGSVQVNGSTIVSPPETTTYTITVSALGGTATDSVTISVTKPTAPPTVTLTASPSSIGQGESATLSWTSTGAENAHMDNGVGTVLVDGSVSVSPEHTTTYTIIVTGSTGSACAQAVVFVAGNPEPQPEGSFGEEYEDLIPEDSTVAKYDPKRFSLVTGSVQDVSGTPLSGVFVVVHTHPEYGTVTTGQDGRFSIPVQGGGVMTLIFQKADYITVHRKIHVPWNDIAILETLKMISQDPAVTEVVFDGNPNSIITHESSDVSDEFGSRSCMLVFQGDNRAYAVDDDGNEMFELETITARATEFTTEDAMPARLPPNSAYTYCVELSADGVRNVVFDEPVITWVDNFLGFEVGEAVPVGYYDRVQGVWVPQDNGVVARLLDEDMDGIVDALDADGDGFPDDLNENGTYDDEVTGLDDSSRYLPGDTFWRVEVTHFTPWDCNWPYAPPSDATPPNPDGMPDGDQQGSKNEQCPKHRNSFIEERSRIFHEDIPIPGTDITLHYAGNRVEGYKTALKVPASGDTVPESLKRILVEVDVAGRKLTQTLSPLPDQMAEFVWDGLDFQGNRVRSAVTAHIHIGFVYDAVYYTPGDFFQAFAQAGSRVTGIRARQEVISWKDHQLVIRGENSDHRGVVAAGWSLSAHHSLDPVHPDILLKGDGKEIEFSIKTLSAVAGNGFEGYSGDGGAAVEASLDSPHGTTVDSAGNLYIADQGNHRIRKVDSNGVITTVAGNGSGGYGGDGGVAIEASLLWPEDIAIDSAGNFYISDSYNHRIRKVDTSGVITTVAGNGFAGYGGDGGAAIEASLNYPSGIAVDSAGNFYISDRGNYRIRKVDTGGVITTVAGNGSGGYSGDGGIAIEASMDSPYGITVDNAGNLYIADLGNYRIRKVDISGAITTVAGNGSGGYNGDGGIAIEASLNWPRDIATDRSGNLYIADLYNHRIRKVDNSGIISTVAGNGTYSYSGDGGPAIEASCGSPHGIAVDSAGNLYAADYQNQRVFKIVPLSNLQIPIAATMEIGDLAFAEENGLGYVISSAGRHETTHDLDTGVAERTFGYDEEDQLISVTDQFGNETLIERGADGTPTAIVSPDGLITTLTIDANNHLTAVAYPNGSEYRFEYTAEGLMTVETEPNGNRFDHQFDSNGRLTDATDEEGGHWHFQRTVFEAGDIATQVTSGEGNQTTYWDYTFSTGRFTSTIIAPDDSETQYERSADELTVHKSLPCSMSLYFKYDVDPVYKFKFVKEMKETTPSALTKTTFREKTYQDTDSNGYPDLITETVTVNGKSTVLENNVLQSQKNIRSPEGRMVTTSYDPNTLLTETVSTPGLFDTAYGYDTRGRLTSITNNTRDTSFTYNGQGFLESVTDPKRHTTSYTYDPVGWVTGISRPDGSSLGFIYDPNGNMTVLTTPSLVDHGFGYNRVNLNSTYQTPLSGSYSYVYNKDRRLVRTNFPSGYQINNIYDKTRLMQIQTPEGNIDFTYLCGTKVGAISKGPESITYAYDGKLMTSEALTGTLNQTLSYGYNNDFNLTSFTYAGGIAIYAYDNDGLLTGSGSFTISRNAGNGLPEEITGVALDLVRSFNGYGEAEEETYRVNAHAVTAWDVTRDDNGRITHKTEAVEGIPSNYVYSYDPMGRLLTVTKDGTLVEEYQYGPNGARIHEVNTLRGITGRSLSYSAGDHLLTAGDVAYQYDVDGYLYTRTQGSEVTTYTYSSRGELLDVTLPDSTSIEYLHDPLGRRIAKKVNDVTAEKYLWQGLTRLLAVYDGSDNLVMRFQYADGRMPYAMTRGGATYYLTYDQVGSLKVIADAAGNVVKRVDYDSFGNIIADTDAALEVPFGFAGGHHDRDTGLVHFGYRDYDPDIGRWTAKDPIGFAGGDTDLYGYCLNDPVNLVDPDGLQGYGWHPGKSFDPLGFNQWVQKKRKQLSETFKHLFENMSNFGPGPKIFIPESMIKKYLNDTFGEKEASACTQK